MRTEPKVLSVQYIAQVHSGGARFTVPTDVIKLLRLKKGKVVKVALCIRKATGAIAWIGEHTIDSGIEVYGPEMASLMSGETIWVEESRPA
jgi:hypothetical protein